MKVEEQVCSLELAKKLKELGVEQESTFYWERTVGQEDPHVRMLVPHHHRQPGDTMLEYWSAFTVAELGEMLPWMIRKLPPFLYLQCEKDHHGWTVRYQFMDEDPVEINAQEDGTEADVRTEI